MHNLRVYLTARWAAQERMRQIRSWLLTRGVQEVTSRWIDAERDADPTPEFFREHGAERARQDFEDIRRADVLILDKTDEGRRRDYMVEYGYALALKKVTILIGQRDCAFTQLADLQYDSWQSFYSMVDVAGYQLPVKSASDDPVNRPAHYTRGKIEVWDAISDWKLDFLEGNVVKYVARSHHKGSQLEDLKKAQAYINKKITEIEKTAAR